jgi:hypothetical protein
MIRRGSTTYPTLAKPSGRRCRAAVAGGTLDPDEAFAANLWPESLITSTDSAFDNFEGVLTSLDVTNDTAVLDTIRDFVLVLNLISDRNYPGYETGERDELCAYIETSLEEAGVDVDAHAARRGIPRDKITGDWRTW